MNEIRNDTIAPLNGYIVFRRDDKQRRSESGLLEIPDLAAKDSMFGVVVAAKDDACVRIGQRCLIGTRRGQVFRHMGEELTAIKADDVLAVCED